MTCLIDLWKAYELVVPGVLWQEAVATGYPLRCAWLAIASYQKPRVLSAFRSYSKSVVSFQGNIAGCTKATTFLRVVLLRALRRVARVNASVALRVLVDDISIQWAGM